ncbi:MAG: translesion error-prone DNA polymerase V autoproteolytic subunit [Burkholderiaceae bacterium]|nr:translesion error-prone DNA polymerase V autoproteolytic subunit [Burkholderiaceae bacterium]
MWLTQFIEKVQAGFPSPAEDLGEKRIDLTAELITHPAATFLLIVRGLSMIKFGIFDGDLLVVNRAREAKHGSIVVAVVDGEVTVKQLYKRNGQVKLKTGNPTFADITFKEGQQLVIWGVVSHAIKTFKT